MYDTFTDLFTQHLGDNLHLGYWHDDDDDASIAEATDRITDMVAARLSPGVGGELLDLGCGSGRPALRIASTCRVRVTGVTVSPRQVETAQARAASAGQGTEVGFEFGDAMALPFPDGRFSGAYAIESLLHMSDPALALAEVSRTLRRGAPFVAVDFYQDGDLPPDEAAVMDTLHRAFQLPPLARAGEHERHMADAGLELTGVEDITGNVRRSHRLLADAMRTIARTGGFPAGIGKNLVQYADLNEQVGIHPQVHYVILTARRA